MLKTFCRMIYAYLVAKVPKICSEVCVNHRAENNLWTNQIPVQFAYVAENLRVSSRPIRNLLFAYVAYILLQNAQAVTFAN